MKGSVTNRDVMRTVEDSIRSQVVMADVISFKMNNKANLGFTNYTKPYHVRSTN